MLRDRRIRRQPSESEPESAWARNVSKAEISALVLESASAGTIEVVAVLASASDAALVSLSELDVVLVMVAAAEWWSELESQPADCPRKLAALTGRLDLCLVARPFAMVVHSSPIF